MSDINEIAKDNALADAGELADEIGRKFLDEDVIKFTREGINLVAASERFVEKYDGGNSFVRDLRPKQMKYGRLTTGQARGALNVMRSERLGLAEPRRSTPSDAASSTPVETGDPRDARQYDCYKCGEEIVGIKTLYAHKKVCSGKSAGAAPVAPAPEPVEEEEVSVIAVTTSTMDLDLSALPNGRYAAPDLNNDRDNDFLFFSVTRVKKDKTRDRRFRYGKIVTGRERVPAGTIEVKEWSSDSKRLFGEQRPGEVYKGEFEEHINLIMASPESWARIFGQMIGRCFRCGKKLTDEDSRDDGFGPECAKHINDYRIHR